MDTLQKRKKTFQGRKVFLIYRSLLICIIKKHYLLTMVSMFFPKNYNFGKYFQELCSSVQDIAQLFDEVSKDFKNAKEYSSKAKILEKQADNIAKQITNELNVSFITPYEREDLYDLVIKIDDAVDYIENVIHMFRVYSVDEKPKYIDEFSKIFIGASQSLSELIFEVFQVRRDSLKIDKLVIAIHEFEGQADEIYLEALHKLFKDEKNPIEVIKWKEIVEELENIADTFKDISNSVVNMLIKVS